MSTNDRIEAELAKQGLRVASVSDNETGWFALVSIDGRPIKVWATEIDTPRKETQHSLAQIFPNDPVQK